MRIADFTHLVMPFVLTNFQKRKETMKYCHFFCTNRLSEIKRKKKQQKTNVSLGMIYGNSSKLVPCFWPIFADFQDELFFLLQAVISQPSINQVKHFMDQNLSWLIVN